MNKRCVCALLISLWSAYANRSVFAMETKNDYVSKIDAIVRQNYIINVEKPPQSVRLVAQSTPGGGIEWRRDANGTISPRVFRRFHQKDDYFLRNYSVKDTPVKEFLANLGKTADLRMCFGDNVQGKITGEMADVTCGEIIEAVAVAAGLNVVVLSGTIFIGSDDFVAKAEQENCVEQAVLVIRSNRDPSLSE